MFTKKIRLTASECSAGADCAWCGFPFDVDYDQEFSTAITPDDGFTLFCGRRCLSEYVRRFEPEWAREGRVA